MEYLEDNGILSPAQLFAAYQAADKMFPGWKYAKVFYGPKGGWILYNKNKQKLGFLPAPQVNPPYYP